MATAAPINLTPGTVVGAVPGPTEGMPENEKEWPLDVNAVPIPVFDTGVFITEMINNDMLPKKFDTPLTVDEKSAIQNNPEILLEKAKNDGNRPDQLLEGTYRGTQLALTKIYDLIEKKYGSFMDTANFEPTVPSPLSLDNKKQFFRFATDNFPPHLNLGANKGANADVPKLQGSSLSTGDIFNKLRLAQLTALIPSVIPKKIFCGVDFGPFGAKVGQEFAKIPFGSMGTPDKGTRIADVERYNNKQSDKWWFQKDVFNLPNIGNLPDWYSDARFAQQFFTGTNPTTIEKAGDWVQIFIDAATDPQDKAMKAKISQRAAKSPGSLYVQDYSYIRKAAGDESVDTLRCEFTEIYEDQGLTAEKSSYKYGVAAVCLFNLTDDGKLEPLAIIIDWRGSGKDPKDSVFIYNRELNTAEQEADWPWRFAKTCVQSSDWIRHNLTVHLTRTHLIEESVIVAANRTLPQDHDVFQLLYPHWQKTLSLNAAARSVLIPFVIVPLIGMKDHHAHEFIRSEYKNFDFKGSYIPDDLRSRGFAPEHINDRKYHNYAWARCILSMWFKIRRYVETMLRLKYRGQDPDIQVRQDEYVQNWSKEMRAPVSEEGDGADISTFPEFKTLDDLIDAVTMCIHIASPQHTSVNYLQNYYQAFVINKPPCLYAPPPTTRDELLGYTESDVVAALPMNHTHDWLLASHIPYLLSFKPGDKESLIIYAASKYHVYKFKTDDKEQAIAAAAARFYMDLAESELEFKKYGEATDDHMDIVYNVLSPSWNAVSILI
ncbi:Lipoxygenase [Xylariaceae sp. FL1019]|nr:Lipoxygenase [Xylariaceae sp. FL1019]